MVHLMSTITKYREKHKLLKRRVGLLKPPLQYEGKIQNLIYDLHELSDQNGASKETYKKIALITS